MTQPPKILGIIFICLIITQTILFLGVNFSGEKALAEPNEPKWTIPDPEIKLFKNFKFTDPICVTDQEGKKTCSIPWIGEYIVGIYKYAIGVVGILAAVVMMFGGVRWIMAGGNASAISEAKAWIAAALTGLVLALASYTILYYINPSLTQPIPIKVASIKEIKTGCCKYKNGGGGTVEKIGCPKEKGVFFEGQIWDAKTKKCVNPVWGCCIGGFGYYGHCFDVNSQIDCPDRENFIEKEKCINVNQCLNTSCQSGDAYIKACKKDGLIGICNINNDCVNCKELNDTCSALIANSPCCAGMCCDRNNGKCISGTPQNGIFCN